MHQDESRTARAADCNLVFRIGGETHERIDDLLRLEHRRDRHDLVSRIVCGVLEERRVHRGRHHGADTNTGDLIDFELLSQRAAKPNDTTLGGSIRCEIGGGNLADYGRDIDENAALLLMELSHRVVAAINRAD